MAAGATALGVSGSPPAHTAGRGRSVVVLGGGMAGLTAAHELVERGFAVTVFEPTAWGGKARSIGVPGTARGGRGDLPGEHGFRFFPGFYQSVPDSMRRIPFGKNANGVWDNLVDADGSKFLRGGDRADAFIFGIGPDPEALLTVDGMRRYLTENLQGEAIPPDELGYFVERLLVFLTSSKERRFGQWENVPWWDFVGAATRSPDYQRVLAAGLTRNLVAAKETVASTRTIGTMGEAFVHAIAGAGADGAIDRVLDLPTDEAWIRPWMKLLRARGVRFVTGHGLERFEMKKGRVAAVWVSDGRGHRRRVEADWYVSAMPVDRLRHYLSAGVLRADPALEGLRKLRTDWMVGIQFFLKRRVDIVHGHMTFIDAPWALTALTQAQFWADRDFAADYGDGKAVDCLSVDISNWDAPGILFGKPAKQCTRQQVAQEVWAQIHEHHTAAEHLPDDIIHSWFLDPGVAWDSTLKRNRNATPLLVNTARSWANRPEAATGIPNLFLAGDFVRTNIDLATMEGANESARAATNAICDAAGSRAAHAEIFELWTNPALEPVKLADAGLYRAGLPNPLDVPLPGRY